MSNDVQFLTNRLLAALNSNYEVIDMSSVLSVITQLEQTTITTEQLEATRLARFLNLLRKRTWSESLARRAKDLLKKWRELLITPARTNQQQQNQQHTENLPLPTRTPLLHISLSQPTSPVVPALETQRVTSRHYPGPANSMENSSLPEYPSKSVSMLGKSVPSTSRTQQLPQNVNSLSNGGQHRGNNSLDQQLHRTQTIGKGALQKSSKNPLFHAQSTSLKKQPQQQSSQPISFANLIETQLHPPGTVRSACAGPSFLTDDNRSQSPLSLPRITRIPHDRQSPMIIEHSVSPLDLDQNSNHSQEVSLIPPPSIVSGPASLTVMSNNNNTISSCSRLLNGDYRATSLELHDSNSNSNVVVGNVDAMIEVQQRFLGSRSSEHRKSKKHKKEKKRHKQERMQDTALAGSSEVNPKPPRDDNAPVLSDETLICGSGIFPVQENLSLSSSSLSMFPSTSATNTHAISTVNRGVGGLIAKTESDLSFAGKFKKTFSSAAAITGGVQKGVVDEIESSSRLDNHLVDNEQESTYTTVINPTKKAKHKDDGGRSSVVVIESRSCSPFTPIGGNSNDSSTASSQTSNRDLIEVVNVESQGVDDIQMRSLVVPRQQQEQQQHHHHHPHHPSQPLKPLVGELLAAPEENKTPKRRGRKKGSKGADAMLAQFNTQLFEGSRLLSLASLSGSKKVKTTKELLADIQSRKLESATSSPTLPSQSRPPSTSSEPSLHSPSTSDACSTNATMSTVARSTPDQNIVSASNFRTSGVDDDSGSNSSGTAGANKKGLMRFEDEEKPSRKVQAAHSIERDIQKLMARLPQINRDAIEWEPNEDVVCTCTVREVQPKQETDVVMSIKEGASTPLKSVEDEAMPASKPSEITVAPVSSSVPVKVKLPQKPVKSIFDLDYDEENDPLRKFVEAAKSCRADRDSTSDQQLEKGELQTSESVISISLPAAVTPAMEPASNTLNGNSELFQSMAPGAVTATVSDSQSQQPPPSLFPELVVVEDPDCQAKKRYELQTNRITKFHINALHNRFIPNVNGNWDESEPKIPQDGSDEILPTGLYVRVVPQYNFLVMDKIPKDLSNVPFTKNYNKIKRLKLKRAELKRKRSVSSSAADVVEDENRDCKHRLKESTTSTVVFCDQGVRSETLPSPSRDSNNFSNCTDNLSECVKATGMERKGEDHMDCSVTDEEDSKERVNGVSPHPPPPPLPPDQRSNSSRRSSSCSNSSVILSNSISCRNSGRKRSNAGGDNSGDNEEASYAHNNYSEEADADDDEDDEYDGDEDEDEDDDYGDFHAVVMHDMTSSMRTDGNKLVLTIKKTPSKTTQSSPSQPASFSSPNGTAVSNKRKILDDNADTEKLNSVKDMAVEPVDVNSYGEEKLDSNVVMKEQLVEDNDKAVVTPAFELTETVNSDEHKDIRSVFDSGDHHHQNQDSSADAVMKTCSSPGDPAPEVEKSVLQSDDDDVEQDELPDGNNELLLSFNRLSKENCSGVRVEPSTGKSQQFKEWHEVLQLRSYNDELLTILPYVVID